VQRLGPQGRGDFFLPLHSAVRVAVQCGNALAMMEALRRTRDGVCSRRAIDVVFFGVVCASVFNVSSSVGEQETKKKSGAGQAQHRRQRKRRTKGWKE
jgi:hypothetical protein